MIPYSTDAPIYHWPVATVTLIVLNILLFFAVPAKFIEPDDFEFEGPRDGVEDVGPGNDGRQEKDDLGEWDESDFEEAKSSGAAVGVLPIGQIRFSFPSYTLVLEHGNGLKPWQWLTSMFLHAGILHLLFNMIALWAFGLVVEGKVGSWVFLGLYLAIGVSQSALEQTLMLFSTSGGGSLGANAAIFGLLGIAIVWAPRNEFEVFFGLGFYATTFEIPIMMYGGYMFIIEFISIALSAFQIASGALHLIALGAGFGLGFVWLQRGWVDCEGWDILSVWKGNEGNYDHREEMDDEAKSLIRSSLGSRSESLRTLSEATPKSSEVPPIPAPEVKVASPDPQHFDDLLSQLPGGSGPREGQSNPDTAHAEESLKSAVENQNYTVALKLMESLRAKDPSWKLPQQLSGQLIRGLLTEKKYAQVAPLMHQHIGRFEDNRSSLQLNLAKIYIHLERPSRAIAVLKEVDRTILDDKQKASFKQLATRAKQMIKQGTIELQD